MRRAPVRPTMALVLPLGGMDDERMTASMPEKLPSDSDTMVRIQEFPELPDRVHCAGRSKLLRKLFLTDCEPLWRETDFRNVMDGAKRALTDGMLSSLLIRVNARNARKILNLESCKTIRGTGLAPLSGSEILEKLDLPQHDGDLLDEGLVVPILRTMISCPFSQQDSCPILAPPRDMFAAILRDKTPKSSQRAADMCFVSWISCSGRLEAACD